MTPEYPRHQPERLSDAECQPVIAAYLAEDTEAADRLSRLLDHHARLTVQTFINPDPSDTDDLVQDTVISVMAYLKQRSGFTGSLVNFTISVARNRCRNFLIWKKRHAAAELEPLQSYLASRDRGPLDTLAEDELYSILQQSLDLMDDQCRKLLRALYLEERSIEEMRREAGLTTVQSVYYRRAQCLKTMARLLKTRLLGCSLDGEEEGGKDD